MSMTSASHKEEIKSILQQYLKHVVYIDDEFTLSLVGRDKEINYTTTKRVFRHIPSSNTPLQQDDDLSHYSNTSATQSTTSNLEALIDYLQRDYNDIRLFPVKYLGLESDSSIQSYISSSNLTIIDWYLHQQRTAVKVIKDIIKDSEQMHLIVVYTSNTDEAERDFVKNIDEMIFFERSSASNAKAKYKASIYNGSIIMLCSKNLFDIREIINEFTDLIIENFGYFPVVFFQTISNLAGKTGKLLKKFAQPFESLLILQMHSSEAKYNDFPDILANVVVNNISDEIQVDSKLIDMIYSAKINQIHELAILPDEEFKELFYSTVNILTRYSIGNKENFTAFKSINIQLLKSCLSSFDPDPSQWSLSIKTFINEVNNELIKVKSKQKCKEYQSLKMITDDTIKEEITNELENKFIQLYKKETYEWLEKFTPIFLTILCDKEIPSFMPELISTFKLVKYEEINLDKILDGCIVRSELKHDKKEDQQLKPATKKIVKSETAKNLRNIFYSGDIIINDENEYMLCIMPSCDAFRPEKVDFMINFIRGKRLTDIPSCNIRNSSEHLTVIPDYMTNELICIKWQFFNSIMFDLNNEKSVELLMRHKRPYRLATEYTQQILNKYAAYYSRAGVEEIFIKQVPQIGNIFFNMNRKE